MKMAFNVQTPRLENAKENTKAGAREVLWRCMVKMEGLAKMRAPVDTGLLKARIHLEPMQRGASEITLSDGVSYGIDVEYGNRPHHVPLKSLVKWVKRKNIRSDEDAQFAFAKYVQKKIKTEGQNAQPFFIPALHEVQHTWLKIYKKEVFGK